MGSKWKAHAEVDLVISRLKHKEIVSRGQKGNIALRWGEALLVWYKDSRKEMKELEVSEMTKMEVECYKIKAVAQGQQGTGQHIKVLLAETAAWQTCGKSHR